MMSHTNRAYENEDSCSYDDSAASRDTYQAITYENHILSNPVEIRTTHRSTKTRYISVAILCFINLINYMDRFTIAGVLSKVQKYYSLNDTEAGLIQTSFIMSYMIMAPIFGYLGDRYNRKVIIIFGVSFWSITTLLGSYVPSHIFGLFIFLRALVGTGEASYSTVAPTIIADLFSKDQRSRMIAIFYFAIPVGSGLGYILGDQVTAIFGHWYWALRVTPVLGLVAVVLTFIFIRDPPRGEAEGSTNLRTTALSSDLLDLCKTKSYVWSTLGFTCVTFATGALAWFSPKYMEIAIARQSTVPAIKNAALMFGVITCIAGIVGVMCGSFASQYFRRINGRADPLICAFGVLMSVPLIYAGVVLADKQLTLSWVLIFIGEICLCVNWTIVADMLLYLIIPTRRAMAQAVQILIAHALGDASSPYIIGMVSDSVRKADPTVGTFMSLQYALYIPTCILVFGALCFFVTAMYIEKDKAKCSLITHGVYPPLHIFPEDQITVDGVMWPNDTGQLV